MTRVVLDTNVLVSALLFKGPLTRFVELWRNGSVCPIISKETFAEMRRVLHYPKFALTAEEIHTIINDEILPFFDVVDVTDQVQGVCREPFDNMFLSVAVSAQASWLVTGDKDLLDLRVYQQVGIIPPQQFLAEIDR